MGKHHFFLAKWILTNSFGIILLGLGWYYGLVQDVIDNDVSHLSQVIFVLFLVGMFEVTRKTFQLSQELHKINNNKKNTKYYNHYKDRLTQGI